MVDIDTQIETNKGSGKISTSSPKPPKPEVTTSKRTLPVWESSVRERIKTRLKHFSKTLSDLKERDVNEADTRLFVTDILCDVLGFD